MPTWPEPVGACSVGGAGAMVIELLMLVVSGVPEESVTLPVKLNVPTVVGMPVMAPVPAVSVNPAGSAPAVIENV